MSDSLYTQRRNAQSRGPTTSESYNDRIEENYRDLVVLSNRSGALNEDMRSSYGRLAQDFLSLQQRYNELESRVGVLEDATDTLTFYSNSQIDNSRFDATSFAVPLSSRCFHDDSYGIVALPKSSSISKLKLTNADGTQLVPSSFEAIASSVAGSLDGDAGSEVVESDTYYSIINEVGKVWERHVIASSTHPDGAAVDLYVRLPTEFVTTDKANVFVIHPYPVFGCDVESIEYTTAQNVNLNSTDGYVPLNTGLLGNGNTDAVGWVAPGAWSNDKVEKSGNKAFYFDPTSVTGLKVRLRQKSYINEGGKSLYAYGISHMDLRYDSFADTGKFIAKFDAPVGQTISTVSDVEVDLFNVATGEKPYAFDYRVIWETSYESGTYTTTPVPSSQRVWVEITLNKTNNGASPALSGLTITYS
jgi:hypothetical protein